MREFPDVERRIERLYSAESLELDDSSLVTELEDVLSRGYAAALAADAHRHQLAQRIEHMMKDLNCPQQADAVRRLARERRTIEDATRRLRSRLGMVGSLLVQVVARSESA